MPLSPQLIDALKDTLLGGGYSLLLGAGVSRDSKNKKNDCLPLGDDLRQSLVRLKEIRPNSSLARAYGQLTVEEIQTYITEAFSECRPGPTVGKLAEFLWKRVYTLNIDDCLEGAYRQPKAKQKCTPLTYKDNYRHPDNPSSVQIVHVHGWVTKPEDGYVFSLSEYAGGMGPGNPWVDVLAQTLASEPFIIAGTTLEESDLEYFLSRRSPDTVRQDRGPSFLIEPNPDAGTLRECTRHGLTLYTGTLLDFLSELDLALPSRPLPAATNFSLESSMFSVPVTQVEIALFCRDFLYLVPKSIPDNSDLGFFVGRHPGFDDIALGRDIARAATTPIKSVLRAFLTGGRSDAGFLLFYDDVGTGKSTIAYRAAYDLAGESFHVFVHQSTSAFDFTLASKIFSNFKFPFILLVDNIADSVGAFRELYKKVDRNNFVVFGADRSYRRQHVETTLSGLPSETVSSRKFTEEEARALIIQMDKSGLTTESYKAEKLALYAKDIKNDCVAISVCRVMQDFRPLSRIISSLVADSDLTRLERYLACSIAVLCYHQGIIRSVLVAAFDAKHVGDQFNIHDILPLTYSDRPENNYVIPANPVLSERILRDVAEKDPELVFETYCTLGSALAPYVDRTAIQRRTPEAKNIGRLFDYDAVVYPILRNNSEKFYIRMERFWKWNSRFWEQFALMKLDQYVRSAPNKDERILVQAITHARHAVRVEKHPLPLTTLGTVLLEDMKANPARRVTSFAEAYDALTQAILLEKQMSRIAIHPYNAVISGALTFVKSGGSLNSRQKDTLRKYADDVESFFSHEQGLLLTIVNLRPFLK